MTEDSARVLIGGLDASERTQLQLYEARSFEGRDPEEVRAAFLGAIAVLTFRRKPVTVRNLEKLLFIDHEAIGKFLEENLEISALIDQTT